MAGVKGRSGGAREGAGRKPAAPVYKRSKKLETGDPDEFLRAVMIDPSCSFKDRMAAALALKKSSPGGTGAPLGKKQQQQQAARDLVAGRSLSPLPPPTVARMPRLSVVK